MARPLKRLLTPPLMALAALLLFVEEVLWEALKRVMAALGRLPLIHAAETWLSRLPPYGAMAVFLAPGTLLLPVKLIALWLLAHGQVIAGCTLIISAKIAGTALVARIFTLTKPALLQLAWFAALHGWIMAWRERLYGYIQATAAWQRLAAIKRAIRHWLAELNRHWRPGHIGRRLRAIQRRNRRAAFR